MCELLIPQAPTNFFQTLHPSISAWTTHRLPLITSPSKMTTVLIRRNAPTYSCRNLTALMPRCTKTSFLITPHYIFAHRNSDNLHNAAFKGYSLVGEWRTSTLLWSYISCTSYLLLQNVNSFESKLCILILKSNVPFLPVVFLTYIIVMLGQLGWHWHTHPKVYSSLSLLVLLGSHVSCHQWLPTWLPLSLSLSLLLTCVGYIKNSVIVVMNSTEGR